MAGGQDSNFRIKKHVRLGLPAIMRPKEWQQILCRSPSSWGHGCLQHRSQRDANSLMQRFESCRPSQPVRSPSRHILRSLKTDGTARFRRYELFSVCGIWQWKRHSCLLSPRAFFWCLVFECASEPSAGWRRPSLSRYVLDGCNTKSTGTAGGLQFSFRHFTQGAAYLSRGQQ
jgi:hypothetical protein